MKTFSSIGKSLLKCLEFRDPRAPLETFVSIHSSLARLSRSAQCVRFPYFRLYQAPIKSSLLPPPRLCLLLSLYYTLLSALSLSLSLSSFPSLFLCRRFILFVSVPCNHSRNLCTFSLSLSLQPPWRTHTHNQHHR